MLSAPHLTFTFIGTPGEGDLPARVYAQLVDVERGVVVGNEITPIAVELDGASHTVDIDFEMLAQSVAAGETVCRSCPQPHCSRQRNSADLPSSCRSMSELPVVTSLSS